MNCKFTILVIVKVLIFYFACSIPLKHNSEHCVSIKCQHEVSGN